MLVYQEPPPASFWLKILHREHLPTGPSRPACASPCQEGIRGEQTMSLASSVTSCPPPCSPKGLQHPTPQGDRHQHHHHHHHHRYRSARTQHCLPVAHLPHSRPGRYHPGTPWQCRGAPCRIPAGETTLLVVPAAAPALHGQWSDQRLRGTKPGFAAPTYYSCALSLKRKRKDEKASRQTGEPRNGTGSSLSPISGGIFCKAGRRKSRGTKVAAKVS